MNFEIQRKPSAEVVAEWLAVGVFEGQAGPPESLRNNPSGELIAELLGTKEFTGELGTTLPLHTLAPVASGSILVFGLGPKASFGPGEAFTAGVAVSKKLSARKRGAVAFALPVDEPKFVSAITEGLVVGTRGPGLRKSAPNRHPFDSVTIVGPADSSNMEAIARAVERGVIVGESVNLARDLVNTPPSEKSPSVLAAKAREVAIADGIGVDVWDASRIEKERFGGLLGVAKGSDEPPAFVVLDYHHGGDGQTLALVGKGVTFDSGGLSLKPSASMEDMKSDMTGAAVVLATFSAVARLKLPVNLRGYLAITENMTGGKALKLGDVLTMRNGKTVEILNTDAEGRLILADALSYATEFKPDRMIDLATLTGACIVALGLKTAGLFSADDAEAQRLMNASVATGEKVWRLPLEDDYKDALKSHVADLKNVGGKWGGAATAARFLQEFVGETPWVHLDIAGPSWADSDSPTRDAGGTGCYVRTLTVLIEKMTNHPST